ncbi:hypothetical protein IAI10_14970 [Clostridium sp. 19966]|uniref:hypothetical protein n=1 Tax=Clostridium sp. 19966 TaxID=2768166 RepID=UPI0028DEBD4B|nr:hypothetical protein [Clostridium sp. 19966]MDT8717965.1 hypothetical protein [Clostridium sp. 19966]
MSSKIQKYIFLKYDDKSIKVSPSFITMNKYIKILTAGEVGQHMNFIHGKAQWNPKWMGWIDNNPDATRKDIYQFAGKMMDDYGLSSYKIHQYGK